MAKDSSRRGLLKGLTLAIGGLLGVAAGIPVVRSVLHPIGRKIISIPDSFIDIAGESELVAGAAPVRLPVIASNVRDAWNVASNVAIGSCWVSKDSKGEVRAFTSVCPHLGCSVRFVESTNDYQCPCHNSAFSRDGSKKGRGPAKRGLDPLAVSIEDGRVKVRYQRFRNDIAAREIV